MFKITYTWNFLFRFTRMPVTVNCSKKVRSYQKRYIFVYIRKLNLQFVSKVIISNNKKKYKLKEENVFFLLNGTSLTTVAFIQKPIHLQEIFKMD